MVNRRARSSAHDKSAMRLMRSLAAIDQPSEQASDMLAAPATATARTLVHISAFLLAASRVSSSGLVMAALIHINLRVRTALKTSILRSPKFVIGVSLEVALAARSRGSTRRLDGGNPINRESDRTGKSCVS